MIPMRYGRRRALQAALLAMAAPGCTKSDDAAQGSPVNLPQLRFGYDLWPGYYPGLIARDKGFFGQAGISVQAIKPEATDIMLEDFAAGKYDAVAVALGDIVSLTESFPDVVVAFATDESAGGDAVIANDDVATVQDLRGKRLGTNLGGFGELFLTAMLKRQGIAVSEVTMVDIEAADLPAKLASGDLDAGHAWEPYASEAIKQGGHKIYDSSKEPGLIPDVVAFRRQVVRDRKTQVRAFVRAWFQAVDYWKANPQDGDRIAAQALAIGADTISLEGIKLQTLATNRSLLTQGDTTASLYYTTKLYSDFYKQKGILTTLPDVQALLDPSLLP